MKTKKQNRNTTNRKKRVRAKIGQHKDHPRLNVYRSNRHIYAQIIDDNKGKTLVAASEKEIKAKVSTKTESAKLVGEMIAKKAKIKKINTIRFDRGAYKYHGRIKALAEAARKGGLKF